jgi:hypothetical protein
MFETYGADAGHRIRRERVTESIGSILLMAGIWRLTLNRSAPDYNNQTYDPCKLASERAIRTEALHGSLP